MRVCVVGGGGRLGLPIAAWSAHRGNPTKIADIDSEQVHMVNVGCVSRLEPGVSQLVREGHETGMLGATTNVAEGVQGADIIIVIVPTPSNGDGSFSLEYVLPACEQIARGISSSAGAPPTIMISSTVMPGACMGPIRGALGVRDALSSEVVDEWPEPCGIVYSPEFVRQGSIIRDFASPDFVLIGESSDWAGSVAVEFYRSILRNNAPIARMSVESAEIAKIGLNAAVVNKIAVANTLAMLCHEIPGADASNVLAAVGTDERIGSRFFNAGTWPGGPCFPRDCRALACALENVGVPSILPDGVSGLTGEMVYWLATKLEHLADEIGASHVGILGLAYKPGVDIIEESQGLLLANTLHVPCHTYDPVLVDPNEERRCATMADLVRWCDVIVIMTLWPEFIALCTADLAGKVIFDMWGVIDSDSVNCDVVVFGEGG